MANSELNDQTRSSMLLRLRNLNDQDVWGQFVEQYAPRIFAWGRRLGLQDADAADVTQIVLAKLVQKMHTFRYDARRGRFRGWLKTVTDNTIRDLSRRIKADGRGSGDRIVLEQLHQVADPGAFEELENVLDRIAESEVLAEAECQVQLRVKPKNWEAWRLTARENVSPSEAAARLGIKVSDVYVARTRVTRMLRNECNRLDGPAE